MTVPGTKKKPPLQIFSKICDSPKNSIIAENCLPGNDSTEWDVNADGDPSIQVEFHYPSVFMSLTFFKGFATKFSVVKGDIVEFKIKTDSSNYRVDIFRVGWFANDRFPIRHFGTMTPGGILVG